MMFSSSYAYVSACKTEMIKSCSIYMCNLVSIVKQLEGVILYLSCSDPFP